MNYRLDIDGLRAVAVLSVIVFHANSSWLPGGFVGVDVFFVISGFVITMSLLGYTGSMKNMLRTFYERRIRRLFPAALLVVLYTTVMAWNLLPPDALAEYARSLIAFTTFWSNWFFWSIAGYFDGPSELKPLLHTWSLSIEEQFYILFPAVTLLLMRRGTGALALFFGAIAVISFAISAWLVATGGTEAAFFNSFGRFWEIALGGLLACGVVRPPSRRLAPVVGFSGLAMIFASFVLLDETTPFPGIPALLPTLGTAAVILAAHGPVNRFLATRPMEWTGAISYGLYLWHWPIFVTITYGIPSATAWHYLAGIVVTFAASTASFYLVEQPIRRRRALPRPRHAFAMFGALAPAVVAAGVAGAVGAGFPQRFPESAADFDRWLKAAIGEQRAGAQISQCWVAGSDDMAPVIERCAVPEAGKKNILIVGDSHAAQYRAALAARWPNYNFDLLAVNSCRLQEMDRSACNELVAWLDEHFPDAGYDAVVVANLLIRPDIAGAIASRARALSEHAPVLVFGPTPHYRQPMPELYRSTMHLADKERQDHLNAALSGDAFDVERTLTQEWQGAYVSPLNALCRDKTCVHFDADGRPLQVDASHLSTWAASFVIERTAPQIEQFFLSAVGDE